MTTPAVVGIDIGGTKISLCAVTDSGHLLARERIRTRPDDGAAAVLSRLVEVAGRLLSDVRARHDVEVCGLAVVTPGVVEADSVRLAPNNDGWEQVALVRTLRTGLRVDAVAADNDAKAATAAEARWGALADVSDGILLNLGTGISAGAVVGGALLRGAHGAALEIAYQVPSSGALDGFAAGRAPLEESFSGAGLQASASALLGRHTRAEEVFSAMARGDEAQLVGEPALLAALGRDALDLAARSVANLAVALDPEVVAVSGGMLRSAGQILPRLEAALGALVPYPPRLTLAHFGHDAPVAGACLLAFETAGLPGPPELFALRGRGPDTDRDTATVTDRP